MDVPGGRLKTTFFYGPWPCRREFINQCQTECSSAGYLLMGCMWLADLKLEWEGSLIALPIPVEAGSRYGIYHCCCNFPTLPKADKEVLRNKWNRNRDSFRDKWSERFGQWPIGQNGKEYPGHHIRDLFHGGDPVDPNNIIPAEPTVHDEFNKEYPRCYDGQAPWNSMGPNLPYTDN